MAPRSEVTTPPSVKPPLCGGLKLTSGFKTLLPGRDVMIKSADGWLEDKIKVDGVWPYWRVHDQLYDLASFMDKHPGGKFWIEATRGSDITESFESSHFGPRPYATLKKYYVGEASTPRNSPFTFKKNGFYMTLKRNVTPILLKNGTGPTSDSYWIQDGLLVTFVTLMVLGGWYQSTPLIIMAGIALGMTAFAAHNFFHHRDNWRMYIFDAFLVSSREWRISHALSHHNFPNTIYDYEIAMLEPFLYFLPRPDKSKFARIFVLIVTTLLVMLSTYYDSIRRMVMGRRYHWTYLIPAIELALLVMFSKSLASGFFYWYIMQTSAAAYFILVGLTVAHHHPDAYHEGDRLPEDRDWGLFQVFATKDRGFVMGSNFLSAISFGYHTLHHLFPTVDMCKLPLLLDTFIETCREFGLEFQVTTIWDLIRGTYLSVISSKANSKLPNVIKNPKLLKYGVL